MNFAFLFNVCSTVKNIPLTNAKLLVEKRLTDNCINLIFLHWILEKFLVEIDIDKLEISFSFNLFFFRKGFLKVCLHEVFWKQNKNKLN